MATPTDDTYSCATGADLVIGMYVWPAWRTTVVDGTIVQIGSNSLADLNPKNNASINPNYPSNPPWWAITGFPGITSAYCGATWDEVGGKLWLPLQGGHADYAGNEGYYLDTYSDSPAWHMTRNPSGAIGNIITLNDGQEATGNYADGRPRAIHSYYKHVYVPGVGPVLSVQGNCSWDGQHGTNRTLLLNEATGEWEVKATHPSPGASSGSGACYDSLRHRIWYRDNWGGRLSHLDIATWTWTTHPTWTYDNSDAYKHLSYLSEFDLIAQFDVNKAPGFVLHNPSNGNISTPSISGTKPAALTVHGYTGISWDSSRFLLWHNDVSDTRIIGTLTPTGDPIADPWQWGSISFSGSTPNAALAAGTFGRFVYSNKLKGCFLQNEVAQKTYFFAIG